MIILSLGRIGGSSQVYELLKEAINNDTLFDVAKLALKLIGTKKGELILKSRAIKGNKTYLCHSISSTHV